MLQYDAVCCSVPHVYRGEELHQHVRCEDSPSEMNQSVLQCVAVCCSVLQYLGGENSSCEMNQSVL